MKKIIILITLGIMLFGSSDRVVMMGHYTGTWKETGKKFRANATHVWKLKDGKATHFFKRWILRRLSTPEFSNQYMARIEDVRINEQRLKIKDQR